MEDVLRWSLLVVGTCLIAGVLAHGLWVSRKSSAKSVGAGKNIKPTGSKAQYQGLEPTDEPPESENLNIEDDGDPDVQQGFFSPNRMASNDTEAASSNDDLGLGSARVISPTADEPEQQAATTTSTTADETVNELPEEQPKVDAPKMYASVVTQPKPEYTARYSSSSKIGGTETRKPTQNNGTHRSVPNSNMPEPPDSLLKKPSPVAGESPARSGTASLETTLEQTSEQPGSVDQTIKLSKDKSTQNNPVKRKEPRFADDQMHIDFDEGQKAKDAKRDEIIRSDEHQQKAPLEIKQEVLVLNVKAPEDNQVAGSALLPMLLTLGFKFGDQDIFHRHVNSNGKGPVLFSLANMFKPGNFDIDNLENFMTQGVSLFMILPIEGDPHQVFNMMHNGARKIADEFGAQVLDGRRSLLTKQSLQQYVEKIREFERQRAIHSHN